MSYQGETVYEFQRDFTKLGGRPGMFWMTYGGGPEGGYIVSPDRECFEVHRNWNTEWTYTPIDIHKLYMLCDEDGCKTIWNKMNDDGDEFEEIQANDSITVYDLANFWMRDFVVELIDERMK